MQIETRMDEQENTKPQKKYGSEPNKGVRSEAASQRTGQEV
jgi:hypothetical protein